MAADYPTIAEQVASAPDAPGVYLWKNAAGDVLYVGKAKSLRKRMRQYTSGQDEREKIPLMMEQVTSFDYVVTSTEVESLVLEKNLIRQFKPPYNVDYRDDKSYPFIALTLDDPFPAIKFTREKHKPGTRYFGPYTDSRAARETIDTVRRIVPICRATCPEWKRVTAHDGAPTARPCFDFHVGLGPGPCAGAVTREEYAENVARIAQFLSGKHDDLEGELERRMREASAELDFETAARYRNRLEAVNAIRGRQKVVSSRPLEFDVVGFFREETVAGVHVFVVREGRLLYGNEFVLDKGFDVPLPELVDGFLLRYYADGPQIPREIVLPELPEDADTVEQWLSSMRPERAARVHLTVPQRAERRDLLDLAEDNARHTLMRFKVRTRYDEDRLNNALLQLESALALPAPPLRIECFDISTLHGTYSVGSMVVFTNGRIDSKSYRRFKVRLDTGEANDFAMMGEVLRRRFAPERMADARFGRRPDLVIVDGGKPQLTAAREVLAESGPQRHPGRRPRQARRGAVRALGRAACCAADRLGLALPRQARSRRGAPLRHRVPPQPARQGDDRQRARRHHRARPQAQEGPAQGVRKRQEAPRGQRGRDRRDVPASRATSPRRSWRSCAAEGVSGSARVSSE